MVEYTMMKQKKSTGKAKHLRIIMDHAKCWWYRYKTQTRENLFKDCPQLKSQQKTLWLPSKK